jgi:hypothetical protein
MKKYILFILSAVLFLGIFAQKTLNVFKPNLSVLNIPVASVDSLKFSNSNTQLDLYTNLGTVTSLPLAGTDSMTFSDSISKSLPIISTSAVSAISYTTAQSGYVIKSIGGTSIIETGICWSTSVNPTVANTKIISAALTPASSVSLEGLTAGSNIYIRAYATNSNGTAYGEQLGFKTLGYLLPTVETTSATYNYSTNKATCVVKVTSNGGCALTERGICWSTSKQPTIADTKYASGTSIGQFYAMMSGLSMNSIYYVRAYATNCVGTAYGAQLTVRPLMGSVTYTLGIDSAANPQPYRLIKIAMDSACVYFNRYTPFKGNISVYYNAGIPTAQASYHGSIGFGPNTRYMWVGTAMHEMCHFMGSGTTSTWQSKIVNGVWTGATASALLVSLTGETLKGDSQHFWPYGVNQKEEITGLGDVNAQANGLSITAKLAKAMIVDDCGLPTSW